MTKGRMRTQTLCFSRWLWFAGLLLTLALMMPGRVQAQLVVSYGNGGLQSLSYNGQILENLSAFPSDAFHIWHMKSTDLSGNVLTSGQYGWGENNNGRSWNASTKTWTYPFTWGQITLQYMQSGNTLNLVVTETNNANSGIIFDGATIYPLVLNFPQLPAGFTNTSYSQYAYNTTAPSVTTADWGSGEVVSVVANAAKPLYSGFQTTGNGNAYGAAVSSTTPDGLATFLPHNDRPVMPGQTDTFTVSLRFAPSGTATATLAADAYKNWAATWPPQLNWTDRRAIGTVYLASSPSGNVNQPGGYPNNPRRYFNDSNSSDFDVTTANGLAKFQAKVLLQSATNVQNLQRLNAQGAITWDIEGEQYPQETSYVCSPDLIGTAAPEMESVVTDTTSRYVGMHLVDAYFKTMTDAGFRVGVCVRPQHFAINPNGAAQQTYLPDSAIAAELIRKMQYAHGRWGATLFYLDSTVESDGAVLDAAIFQQAAAALSDSLLIPEESTPKHYAYTAPFLSFLFHGDLGTNSTIYNYYPKAFSVNLVNDVNASTLAASQSTLTASVAAGDILMAHCDYWQANNDTIVAIYRNAAPAVPTPAPAPTPVPTPAPTPPVTTPTSVSNPAPVASTPPSSSVTITSPNPGDTISSIVNVQGQIAVSLDAAGSYLMVDGVEIGTRRVTSGPFVYPFNTASVSNGTHTLQLWAHDTANSTDLSQTVLVTVNNTAAAPTAPLPAPASSTYPISLTYPVSGQAISGVVQVLGVIPQLLDPAGSYLLLDGVEVGTQRVDNAPYVYAFDTSKFTTGSHTLQLWAHDTANQTLLSNPVTISIGTP